MLKHLFGISSRANRTELLFWTLVMAGFAWLINLLTPQVTFPPSIGQVLLSMAVMLLFIPVFWFGFALSVRRLHDMNLSGWWLLGLVILSIFLNFVIMILFPTSTIYIFMLSHVSGMLVGAIFLFVPGTTGANRFGTYDKPYYPACMDRRWAWVVGVVLLVLIQVVGSVRALKQTQVTQERMKQFQEQMLQMQQQMQLQYQQQLQEQAQNQEAAN